MIFFNNIIRRVKIFIHLFQMIGLKIQDGLELSSMYRKKQQTKIISKTKVFLKNFIFSKAAKKGQGLVEYLIIIAIMGVASIGILRTLNQTVKAKFANAIYALQGRKNKATTEGIRKTDYQKIDFSNFMTGAASKDDKNRKKRTTKK